MPRRPTYHSLAERVLYRMAQFLDENGLILRSRVLLKCYPLKAKELDEIVNDFQLTRHKTATGGEAYRMDDILKAINKADPTFSEDGYVDLTTAEKTPNEPAWVEEAYQLYLKQGPNGPFVGPDEEF